MELKVVKKVEVQLDSDEFWDLEEEFSNCHIGCRDDLCETLSTNVNDLQIYLDNCEMANLENGTTDIARKTVEFANKDDIEEVDFYYE